MLLLLKKSLKEPGMVFSQIIDFVHLKVKGFMNQNCISLISRNII